MQAPIPGETIAESPSNTIRAISIYYTSSKFRQFLIGLSNYYSFNKPHLLSFITINNNNNRQSFRSGIFLYAVVYMGFSNLIICNRFRVMLIFQNIPHVSGVIWLYEISQIFSGRVARTHKAQMKTNKYEYGIFLSHLYCSLSLIVVNEPKILVQYILKCFWRPFSRFACAFGLFWQ